MKKPLLFLGLLVGLAGCGSPSDPPAAPTDAPADLAPITAKLPFRDPLRAWTESLRQASPTSPKGKALLLRLGEDLRALDSIQQLYEKEIEKVFAQFGPRDLFCRG